MATSKIIIKIKDKFFLQKSTSIANPTKLVVGQKFFEPKNYNRLENLYPVIKNAGNILESTLVFQNLINSLTAINPSLKLESLFSVIEATAAVNLMQMAKDRTTKVGENLLNYYFVEVDTIKATNLLNDLNKLTLIPGSGIDFVYLRGEIVDLETELKGISFLEEKDKMGFLNQKTKISSNKKIISVNDIDTNQPTIQGIQALSTIDNIKNLFFNCGLTYGGLASKHINVVDLEQGWSLDATTGSSALNTAVLPANILGGGLNQNDHIHGRKTLNILFGKINVTSYPNRLKGLCRGAKPKVASTWYPTGEFRESALTDTFDSIKDNNGNQKNIVLLELQITNLSGTKLPSEIEPAMFTVIKLGVDAGFIVVEAAGNGGNNLNTFNYNASTKNLSTQSSGAIMVGSCTNDNTRDMACNYGNRIDYSCYGENLDTSSGLDFNSTSLASAITAGLIACFQSQAQKSTVLGRKLTISEIKKLLNPYPSTTQTSFKNFLNSRGISSSSAILLP